MEKKLHRPFITIPLVWAEETPRMLELFGHDKPRALMIEVRVSQESLKKIPNDVSIRYYFPDPLKIGKIFSDDPRALNIIRYSAEDKDSHRIYEDMLQIRHLAGKKLHGFFMDNNLPDPKVMSQYLAHIDEHARFMIRLGPPAFNEMQSSGKTIQSVLEWYQSCVTDIIIDPHGKEGDVVDTDFVREVFEEIVKRYPAMRLCVTGGARIGSAQAIVFFRERYPALSVTTGRKILRMNNKRLDLGAVARYFKNMQTLLTHE